MKFILLILALPVMMAKQCSKNNNEKATPPCVLQKIEEIKAKPRYNPPAEVNEYNYKGTNVYLFTSDCCDQYIMLYDAQCQYICAPSGGLTGKGDDKCINFFDTAKHTRLVWKDGR